jgi:hypothetical protein
LDHSGGRSLRFAEIETRWRQRWEEAGLSQLDRDAVDAEAVF